MVVFSTDSKPSAGYSDRLFVFNYANSIVNETPNQVQNGKIDFEGNSSDLLNNDKVKAAYHPVDKLPLVLLNTFISFYISFT